jgi:hypothetical protein
MLIGNIYLFIYIVYTDSIKQNKILYFKRFIAQRIYSYTVCTRVNYKIVFVTNLYLQYGTSGTEKYVYKYRSK